MKKKKKKKKRPDGHFFTRPLGHLTNGHAAILNMKG
jgi:hypothetical protein